MKIITSNALIAYLKNSWTGKFAALLLVAGISDSTMAQTCATSTNWAQANSYAAGSIVKYTDGNLYIAKVGTGPGIRPTISTYYWAFKSLCTVPAPTPTPVTCNYPDWIEFKQYQTGEIVKYKDAFYKAAYANPGYIPTVSTFSQFLEFSFGATGQLMLPPEYTNKYRLEFVGDSITAGFGNFGVMPCGFSTATESAYWSYAQQTAMQLGEAPATNISISGIGIYRNYGDAGRSASNPSMPFYYSRNLSGETTSAGSSSIATAMQPTVVVVNLGNNDFWNGPPDQTEFVSAYVGLFKTIRSRYPSAMLIAATHTWSNQQGYVQATYNQILNSGEKNSATLSSRLGTGTDAAAIPPKPRTLRSRIILRSLFEI